MALSSREVLQPLSPSLCLSFTSVCVGLSYLPGHVQGRCGYPGDSLGSLQLICLKQPQCFLWGIWVYFWGPWGPLSYSAVDTLKLSHSDKPGQIKASTHQIGLLKNSNSTNPGFKCWCPFISCMILKKSLHLSKPRTSHLKSGL